MSELPLKGKTVALLVEEQYQDLEVWVPFYRLVEAGARCVTVAFGFWDYHGQNHKLCKADLPLLDRGVTALVKDLHDRGLDQDVSVVVWGEFGRSPTINKDAGRDHWSRASFALLAGGGMTDEMIQKLRAHTKLTDFHLGTFVREPQSVAGQVSEKRVRAVLQLIA